VINRTFFFAQVNQSLFGAKLGAKPRATLGMMLDYWEANYGKGDDRWLA